MEAMAHPDGGVSFFNDSVNGSAPTKTKIESYAKKLGFAIIPPNLSKFEIIDNASSGYFSATAAGNKLIFDASPVGPDYIPGHAHADTLSFELSIDTQRVFVNSGISEYGLSLLRLNQRKTHSHNTVEIDGRDSSQVWSSFRVGRRANIVSRYAKLNNDHNIILQAAHNGYASLLGGCIHLRKLTLSKNKLFVFDSIHGAFRKAKSRFHFHPDLIVSLENNLLEVKGENFILHSHLKINGALLSTSSWHPEFGVAIPNKVLELQFEKPELDIVFTWSKD